MCAARAWPRSGTWTPGAGTQATLSGRSTAANGAPRDMHCRVDGHDSTYFAALLNWKARETLRAMLRGGMRRQAYARLRKLLCWVMLQVDEQRCLVGSPTSRLTALAGPSCRG